MNHGVAGALRRWYLPFDSVRPFCDKVNSHGGLIQYLSLIAAWKKKKKTSW